MRLAIVCLLATACGGRPPTPRPPTPLLFTKSGVERSDAVLINNAMIDRGPIQFELDNTTFIARDVVHEQGDQGLIVHGLFGTQGAFTLVRVGTDVTAVFRRGNAGTIIVPTAQGQRVMQYSASTPPRDQHGPGWDETTTPAGPVPVLPPTPLASRQPVIVDVLFAHTKTVKDKLGTSGLIGLVAIAIWELNWACKQDDIPVRFRARIAEIMQTEGTEKGKDLKEIYNRLVDHHPDFIDVHKARFKAKADIAVLLIDKVHGGMGWGTIMGKRESAVAVVDHNDALRYLTIGHEIGHVMGGLHEDDKRNDPPFPFGHGFIGDQYRTIMSTISCTGCTLVNRWSSPPDLGNKEFSHDAKVVRTTGPAVSQFGEGLLAPTPAPPP